MPDTELVQILAEGGISVIAVAVIAWLFWKAMQQCNDIHTDMRATHKEERGEWREEITKGREATHKVLEELKEVIRKTNND